MISTLLQVSNMQTAKYFLLFLQLWPFYWPSSSSWLLELWLSGFSSTTSERDRSSPPCPNYPGILAPSTARTYEWKLELLNAEFRSKFKLELFLFLSSLSSLVKSGDTGNGVTFRSGDNVDLGPSHIGVSFIDAAMQMVSPGRMLISS